MKNVILVSVLLIVSTCSFAQSTTIDSCSGKWPESLSVKSGDSLKLSCDCPIVNFHIEIYDRWGQKVFESAALLKSNYIDWDYSKSKPAAYFFIINYTAKFKGIHKVRKKYSGYTTIVT